MYSEYNVPEGALLLLRNGDIVRWSSRCEHACFHAYSVISHESGHFEYHEIVQILTSEPQRTMPDLNSLYNRRRDLITCLNDMLSITNGKERMLIDMLIFALENGQPAWLCRSIALVDGSFLRWSWPLKIEEIDNDFRRRVGRPATLLKFLNRHTESFSGAEIEQISTLLGNIGSIYEKTYHFEVVYGDAIVDAYRRGPQSCMQGTTYVQFYAENPDKVGLIKIFSRNRYMGRALLWTTDDGALLYDRVYPSDGGRHTRALALYAQKQGWKNVHFGEHRRKPNGDYHTVTMKHNRTGQWPYLDTFNYMTLGNKCFKLRSGHVNSDYDYRLYSTCGTLYNVEGHHSSATIRSDWDDEPEAVEPEQIVQLDLWAGPSLVNEWIDEDGYDEEGYDQWGYDRNGYDRLGLDREGFDYYGRDGMLLTREGHEQLTLDLTERTVNV